MARGIVQKYGFFIPEDLNHINLSNIEFKAIEPIHFAVGKLLLAKEFKAEIKNDIMICKPKTNSKLALFFGNNIMNTTTLDLIKILAIKSYEELKNGHANFINVCNTINELSILYTRGINIEVIENLKNIKEKACLKMLVQGLKCKLNIVKKVRTWMKSEVKKQFHFNLD